jgi:adenosylcobinamide-GDP ribazoletransferase
LTCGLAADGLATSLPPLVSGALGVGLGAVVTGAMHLDGLADTADALGGWSRERSLAIMRDARVGTFGVIALSLTLLVDASALGTLAGDGNAWLAGLGAGAAGRAMILPQAFMLPSARGGEGQSQVLGGMTAAGVVGGVAVAVALATPLGWRGLVGLAVAAALALGLGLLYRRWVGGITGDLLGATAKLTETAFLVSAVAAID